MAVRSTQETRQSGKRKTGEVSSAAAERRAKQTVRNLVLSMLVTLGLVAAIYLGVPRDDTNRIVPVDYQAIALTAASSLDQEALSPEIQSGWWANAARQETTLGVVSWYVGFVTEENQFIALTQAIDSNPSWESDILAGNFQDGEVILSGLTWEVWPTSSPSTPRGTKEYALLHRADEAVVVIYGTAPLGDFETLAAAISSQLD